MPSGLPLYSCPSPSTADLSRPDPTLLCFGRQKRALVLGACYSRSCDTAWARSHTTRHNQPSRAGRAGRDHADRNGSSRLPLGQQDADSRSWKLQDLGIRHTVMRPTVRSMTSFRFRAEAVAFQLIGGGAALEHIRGVENRRKYCTRNIIPVWNTLEYFRNAVLGMYSTMFPKSDPKWDNIFQKDHIFWNFEE